MPNNDMIAQTISLLADSFRNTTGVLEEPAEKMKVSVSTTGNSAVYSFDIAQKAGLSSKDLFPFFKTVMGAHTMCDYMIFAQQAGKLFILLVELKKGDSQAGPQLRAGRNFASFIVNTFNRVYKQNITPEIRMISVHNANVIKKGTTKMKDVSYDAEGFADFKGNTFCVQEFLK